MALKIKTPAGVVNAALHVKTAGGIVPVNLHAKTADGIMLLSGSALPANIVTLQKIRTTSSTAIRARPRESGRMYLIVRNLEPSNIAQIAFTDTTNNNYNAPTTGFTDINPNDEWYETSHQGQVWLRSKTNGQSVTCEIEVAVTRIQ